MWVYLMPLTTVISLAQGMCFGVPLLQQSVSCPEPKIYYPQLCVCLEPKNMDRLNEISSLRELPILRRTYMDSSQSVKNMLEALRHRITASLPDVSSHGYGSSLGSIGFPLIVFPDGSVMPSSKFYTLQNRLPRSWKIGGLLESWSNGGLAAGEIPSVGTGGVFTQPTSGWGTILDNLGTLSLMERLNTLRNLWRNANQAHAESKQGDLALAQKFFSNLPTSGISPDTARSYRQYNTGVPDEMLDLNLTFKKPASSMRSNLYTGGSKQ